MAVEDSPAYHRKALGRMLRRLRRAAGYSVQEAYQRLELSETTLHRMELGKTKVTIHTARSMLDLYGVGADEWDPVLDLVREANKRGWWVEYGYDNKSYVALETAASVVWTFDLGFIHGLLQTEDYMMAVFQNAMSPKTTKQIDNDVKVRRIRQQRLDSLDDPLELVAIIAESALRQLVGGVDVMRAQLRHLLDTSATIRVLPSSVGAHPGLKGSFCVLQFSDADEPDVGYYEQVVSPTFVSRSGDVERCRLTWKHLSSLALRPEESKALITQIMEELR